MTSSSHLVLSLLLVHCMSRLTECALCVKYCSCKHNSMRCRGKGFFSVPVPRPPSSITRVELTNRHLGNLTKDLISNLTYCNLTNLYLHGNEILTVDGDVFNDFRYLTKFHWVDKYMSLQNIYNVLKSISQDLEIFRVEAEGSDVNVIKAKIFLKFPRLTHLGLKLRSLLTFSANDLTHLMNLQYLDLSQNKLLQLTINTTIYNLTDLNLSGNNFIKMPRICNQYSIPVMPRLRDLNIGQNAIRSLEVNNLECLHNLLKLTLSGNRIEILPNNGFAGLHKLESLYIQGLPLTRIEPLAFNSSSLMKLMFAEIPSLSYRRFDPVKTFQNTPNLEYLNLMNTKLDISLNQLRSLLLPLTKLKKIILQGSHLLGLPTGLFSHLSQLETLVVSGNYIAHWRKEVFENVSSIRKLVLDGCNIKMIKEETFPLEFRLHVKEINLADNPFICTCELLWFRNWVREATANKSIIFSAFPYRYECRAPNTNRLRLVDYNPTVKSCTPLEWYVIFLPVFFGTVIVICISGVVAYRYRWYLFYWISLLRRRQRRNMMPLRELKYDAFVSYSNEDSDWVYDELLHYLEGQIGLRLCEHSRDFEGGKLIVDNVFDALDTSNKTILVLSNDYMKSDWCQFELQMALNSFFKHETDLVVVMLEQIQPRHVTSSLRALMTSTTYIEWPPDHQTRDLFRERLKHSVVN